MKKVIALAAVAALAAPSFASAGGLEPEVIFTPPPAQPTTGSLGGATPWIIAGVALGLVALAASDGSD